MSGGPDYAAEELEAAWKMRRQGLQWSVIAYRLDRPQRSLEITAHAYRKGTWAPKGRRVREMDREAKIEMLVELGLTGTTKIAAEVGMSVPATSRRLMRIGLDAEMRRQIAAEGRTR